MRSLLFAPAVRSDLVAKLPRSSPDAIVIDLEDGVPTAHKDRARAALPTLVADLRAAAPALPTYVRINAPGTPWCDADVEALPEGLAGIMVPKLEHREQLDRVTAALTHAGRSPLPVIAGVETARGVLDIRGLLGTPVTAAYFGAEDYVADLGGVRTAGSEEVLYARSRVALACRVAGVLAIDQVVVDIHDADAFRIDAARGRALGYRGKLCIHPAQVQLAREAFTPSQVEVATARALVSQAQRAAAAGIGVIVVDGAMVDEPMLRVARDVLARADADADADADGNTPPAPSRSTFTTARRPHPPAARHLGQQRSIAVPDSLTELISTPTSPLPERWTSAAHTEAATAARALHERDPDEYWAWVAAQQRWLSPWQTLRTGEFGACRYFEGGQINVADNCVDRWAEDPATADQAAVIWEGEPGDVRTVTYRELAHDVGRLAAGLLALGIAKGDVVGIYMPNLVEAFVAIQACNRIGAIYTVLFSGFGEDAVASRLSLAEAKAVIVADASYRRGRLVELLENLRAARRHAPSVEHVVVVDRSGRGVALQPGEVSYSQLLQEQSESAPLEPLDSSDPAFLIFTSGTESKPKGVVHSVGGFLVGTWANVRWQVGPEVGDVYWVAADVGWLTFPIQAAVGGLAQGMTIACYEGAMNAPTAARFYEICERHRVTKVLAAPTLLRMLRSFGDELAAEHPLPDLKLVTVQGEPLDGDTFTWTTEHLGRGVPVINAYGQTETGSTWTYPIYGVDDLKAGSVGTPVPGHEYAVLDDGGAPVAPGVKGNLVMTRPFPTLAHTVWGDHDRYLSTYFERFPGCYATWDEAVVDADGHLWVLGRADDVINIAAHRISTMEIEAVVASHADVTEAAVVGVPHSTKGTVPVAFITVRGSADAEMVSEEARRSVVGQIGGYAQLDEVYVTSAMPKTRTGKIMRRVLRDVVVHGAPTGDISAMEDASALDTITTVVNAGRSIPDG